MNNKQIGKLYCWYHVTCADCHETTDVGYHGRVASMKALFRWGWKFTARGYVCKECAEKATGQEAAR